MGFGADHGKSRSGAERWTPPCSEHCALSHRHVRAEDCICDGPDCAEQDCDVCGPRIVRDPAAYCFKDPEVAA